jgi:PAS domain S-box-containing protein
MKAKKSNNGKTAEEVLQDSERKYRSFIDNFQGIAYRADFKTRIPMFFHGSVEEITGYSEAELVAGNPSWNKIIHKEDLKELPGAKELRSVPNHSIGREYRIVRKDGQIRWVREFSQNVCDDKGKPCFLQGAIYEITDRKRVEEVLKRSEERFRDLFDNINDGILVVDALGTITYFNKIFVEMSGYSASELQGKNMGELIHKEDLKFVTENHKKRIMGKKVPSIYEFRGVKKSGEIIHLEINSSPIRDGKNIVGVRAILRGITKRKEAEKAIQKSEAKYRNLYDSAPDMYHSLDKNGVIVDCNKTWVHATGYEKEEVIGRPLTDFFTEESIRDFEESFPKLNQEKIQLNLEREYVRKDGSTFIASLNVFSEFDGDGKLIETKTISRDITERKRAEVALKESENFLSDIFSSIQDGISILDENMNIIQVNPVMEKWYSHAMTLIGKKCYRAYHNRNKRCEVCPTYQTLKTGKATYEVVPKRDSEGEVVGWLDLYAFPMLDTKTGKINGVIEYVRDITEQKMAQKALEESEERHRVAAELTSDYSYAYRVESTGEIVLEWVTGALTKITGFTRDEISPRGGWEHLIYPEDMQIPLGQLKSLLEGKSKTVEYRIMNKNGDVRWMMDYAKPEWDEKEKRVTGIYGAVQDITERKRAEDALKKAYNELKSIDELKSNLIANVSHELRTPLTIVMSSLELARTEENTEDRNELLDTAAEAMMRQDTIVGDLIEAAQIERGLNGLDLKRTELKEIIDNTLSEFAPIAKQQEIEMNVKLQSDLPKVKADEKQLDHILRNLISNAIKFNKKGGKISIEARKNREFVKTSVTDTGIGIPSETLPKIFDRFYQADSSTSRSYGGTGMGLAVVKEMVESQGGTIGVDSKPGEGSRFYFTLLISDVISDKRLL